MAPKLTKGLPKLSKAQQREKICAAIRIGQVGYSYVFKETVYVCAGCNKVRQMPLSEVERKAGPSYPAFARMLGP